MKQINFERNGKKPAKANYFNRIRLSFPLFAALCFSCAATPISSDSSLDSSSGSASSSESISSFSSASKEESSSSSSVSSSQGTAENAAKKLNEPNKSYGSASYVLAEEYVNSMKDFSQRLFDIASIKKEGESVMFSPLSLATCFSMAYDGARGDTKEELKQAFSIPDNHHEYIERMMKRTYMEIHDGDGNQKLLSEVAEAFFVDNKLEPYLKSDYVDTLTSSYYADAFSGNLDSDPMRQSLADFINGKTNDFFHLTKDDFNTLKGVLWLVNTIYLKANWINRFYQVAESEMNQFENARGDKEKASFIACFYEGYAREADSHYLVDVPLYGGYSFRLLLPKEGVKKPIDDFFPNLLSSSLDVDPIEAEITLTLPEFKAHSKYSLVSEGYLAELGLDKALNPGLADLTGIAEPPEAPLYIGEAIHEAGIIVNKDGIEAAAYTVIDVPEGAAPRDPLPQIKITADRPFLYSIISSRDELPLFVGRLNSLAN